MKGDTFDEIIASRWLQQQQLQQQQQQQLQKNQQAEPRRVKIVISKEAKRAVGKAI